MGGRSALTIALVLAASLLPPLVEGDRFDLLPDQLPTGRAYGSAVWSGSRVYYYGGESAAGALREIVSYDPATGAVAMLPAVLPTPRSGTSAVWTGSVAYVFGGYHGPVVADIVRHDPAAGSVALLGARLPTARYDTSAVWTGTQAFVFGGHDGADLDQIVRFDPASGEVRIMSAKLPYARAATSAAWDGRYAYVFGGTYGTPAGYVSSDEIVRYDPQSDSVSVVAHLPSGRFLMASAWDGSHVHLFGGVNHATGAWARTVRFDPATLDVTLVEGNLSTKREGAVAVHDGSDDIVLGGAYFQAGWQRLRDIVRHSQDAPGAPRALATTSGPENGEITLSWNTPSLSGSFPPSAYRVYAGPPGSEAFAAQVSASVTSWTETGLPPDATRSYRVSAVNAVGEGALSAAVQGTSFRAPDAPAGLLATRGPAPGEIALSWNAPPSAGSRPLLGYRIYAGEPGAPLALVAETPTLSFADTGLAQGAWRAYAVSAFSNVGEGPRTPEISARAPAPPGPPTDVDAAPGAIGAIRVSWSMPEDLGGLALTGFRVYRGDTPDGMTLLAELPADARSYEDEGLGPLASHHYRVSATNAVGEGARSGAACSAASPWHLLPATAITSRC